MIKESVASYPMTSVPPLKKKQVVVKANPLSNDDADDEDDDNDFDVTAGGL